MSAKALVVLADGFEDVEAITVVDVLRRGGVETVTASLSGAPEVRSAHGVVVRADASFADASKDLFDAVVLPGGGEGTDNLKASEELAELLRQYKEQERLICAICAAPTVLEKAGVIGSDQHVTCYPTCQVELDHPWVPAPVVEDRMLITGQAPGSAMLFSLVILKTLEGEVIAKRVARGMVTDVLD